MFEEIYERVSKWKEPRFHRVYSKQMALALIEEEFKEWGESETTVQHVDALCDLIYASMSITWSICAQPIALDHAMEQAQHVVAQIVDIDNNPGYFIATFIAAFKYSPNNYPPLLFTSLVTQVAIVELFGLGFTSEDVTEALLIVCDANDTKAIPTELAKANEKYGPGGGKGDNFVAPEPRLQALVEVINERHH